MEVIQNAVSVFNQTEWDQYISGYKDVLAIAGCAIIVLVLSLKLICSIRNTTKKVSNNSSERKNIIRELKNKDYQQQAIIDGLTLLVGALSKKVEDLEQEIHECVSKIDRIEVLEENLDSVKVEMETKFGKINKNFKILGSKLGDFTDDEFRKFSGNINEQLRVLNGAIFLPEGDDGDGDSEYGEN